MPTRKAVPNRHSWCFPCIASLVLYGNVGLLAQQATLAVAVGGSYSSYDASNAYYQGCSGSYTQADWSVTACSGSGGPQHVSITGSASGSSVHATHRASYNWGPQFAGQPVWGETDAFNQSEGIKVFVLGPPGTAFTLRYTVSSSVQSSTSSDSPCSGWAPGTMSASFSDSFSSESASSTINNGSASKSFNDSKTVSGNTTSDPSAPAGYSLAWSYGENGGVEYQGGCDANYTAMAQFDSTIDVTVTSPASQVTLTCPASSGDVDSPYSSALSATGGSPPYTFSAGALPIGLFLNTATGDIQGTPHQSGATTFNAQATDSAGTMGSTSCTIAISAPPIALACPASTGTVGTPYASGFSASGGTPPYSGFSIISGTLPPGLTMDAVGGLSGTPTAAGAYNFAGSVTDTSGQTGTANCSINITAAPCMISVTPPSASFESSGGTGMLIVNAQPNSCTWTASSDSTWIAITSGNSGTGSGLIGYSVDPNTDATQRQGTITATATQGSVNATHDVWEEGTSGSCPGTTGTSLSKVASSSDPQDQCQKPDLAIAIISFSIEPLSHCSWTQNWWPPNFTGFITVKLSNLGDVASPDADWNLFFEKNGAKHTWPFSVGSLGAHQSLVITKLIRPGIDFDWNFTGEVTFGAEIDPNNVIDEVTKSNNSDKRPVVLVDPRPAYVTPAFLPGAQPVQNTFADTSEAEAWLSSEGFTRGYNINGYGERGWTRPWDAPVRSRLDGQWKPYFAFRTHAGVSINNPNHPISLQIDNLTDSFGEPSPYAVGEWGSIGGLIYVTQYHTCLAVP